MSWFLVILFLSLTSGSISLSEASHDNNKKLLPSAVAVGTVYCDTCFQQAFSIGSHFISGASVAVECKVGDSKPRFYKEVKTNEHGEFKVKLPFSVRKHVKRIKGCSFKLMSSNEPHCAVASASAAATTSLRLKKKLQGEHIFSAGIFSFKPIKKPKLCDQKHGIPNSKGQRGYVKNSEKSQLFSDKKKIVPDPEDFFFFPPIPFLPPPIFPNPFQPPPLIPNPFQPPPLIPNPFQPPSPPLIPNPFQPPSPPPLFPNPFQPPPSPTPLFPNPFQPPPSPPAPLIPNPFQPPPSPTPTPLIPNPFQPPQPPPSRPPPLFPFPPIVIPGLTPSPPPPPPPPPPIFPFPFPPLFPPLFPPPHIPGSPPTSSKINSSP